MKGRGRGKAFLAGVIREAVGVVGLRGKPIVVQTGDGLLIGRSDPKLGEEMGREDST